MNSSLIVQKLWNYCNVLRDGRRSYGDRPALLMNASAASANPLLRHFFVRRASPFHASASRRGLALSPRTAMSDAGSTEQLTYVLFRKMADERDSQS